MSEIARWTTPTVTYKPSAVPIENVDEIYLVFKIGYREVLRKDKDDAIIDANGFTWFLEQQDTSKFCDIATLYIDYTSGTSRYTINPKQYTVTESGIDEVI